MTAAEQPTTGDSALPLPRDSWNPARRTTSVGSIGPALDSTDGLLETIRESTATRPEYIELEQSCLGVREVLGRGTNRKQDDHLSQSALEAIEDLTTTAEKIKKNIVKLGKRRAIFRTLWPKKEKEVIASSILSLNQIICHLEIEFGCGEPGSISDPRRNVAEPHTAAPHIDSCNPSIETATPTPSHDISGSHAASSQVPTEVVNIHALDHETHRKATESIDGSRNPGRSTHVSVPDRSMPPLRNTRGMSPDSRPHVEKMDTIADIHETIDGMPQRINGGTGDGHQMAAESASWESPPPPQRIFGRDELVRNIVDLVDTDHPAPIALIGTGGIGKTSVALAVLHDRRIKQRFGDHRRLLRCDQFPASLPNFLRRLSEVIGAGIPNPTDLTSLRPFLSRNKMLIIIDNAESIFDGPTTKDIDPVVEELSRFRNIWLCITSRLSVVPTRCKVIDIPTLSMEAARDTFHNIYRCEQSDAVSDILKQLEFHPLSVTLLATSAKHNKWDIGQLEKQWKEQRTGVLRTRYQGSLAATIEFSLRSPMFRDLGPHARDLLGVVAFFPQGIDENNLNWLFPFITDMKKIFGRFCVLSLTHRNKGFITMLAPLRDHLRPEDPMSASLLCSVKRYYFSRLSYHIGATTHDNDRTTWIASEDVNIEHLLDVFTSIDANSESVWEACGHFTLQLCFDKPRLPVFGPKIWTLPDDHPSKLECLLKLSSLYIAIGNSAERRRVLCHALKLCRERGDDYGIASTLRDLAALNSSPDLCEEGIQQTREAMTVSQRLGDMMGVIDCHIRLSSLFRYANRLDDAEKCESQATGLIDALMLTADFESRGSLHIRLSRIHSLRGDTTKVTSHIEEAVVAGPARFRRFILRCELAKICIAEGKFDDAEAHLEHARALSTHGSSELGLVMLLRVRLLRGRGKFEEARSEALRALDLEEEFGGVDNVEKLKHLLHSIDEDIVEWASMGELLTSLVHRTGPMMRAALGGDTSHKKIREAATKTYEAATKMMGLLEKDGNRPGGPNFFHTRKAHEELAKLLSQLTDNLKEANEAIPESLAIPATVDKSQEMPPPEPLMRQDNGLVVIRTTDPKLAHVGQLWQALYYVPQVRHRISQYRSPHPPEGNAKVDPLSGGTGGHVLSAHELFGHMELSGLAVVTGRYLVERLPHRRWEGISPCKDLEEAYKEFSEQVEIGLNDNLTTRYPDWPRLFHSRINDATSQGWSAIDAKKDFSLISLGYDDGDKLGTFMGCLASQVFPEFPECRSHDMDHTTTRGRTTMEPADVVAFALARNQGPLSPVAGRSQQRRKFSFPESFCLDQFVTTCRARVQEKNVAEGEIPREAGSGPARPNYDLRAVLMHDGQKGREHVYSYINHGEAWWKVVDYTVTQVTLETVLNDENGVNAGAGPFFLIYSRSLSGPLKSKWPETLEATYNTILSLLRPSHAR